MALLEQGIIGPFRGKCGPVIGYIRNGQFCMRSMPTHYHDRRSKRQLENRSRFTLIMKVMSVVRPIITLGFHRFATDITEMNAATRDNYYSLVKPSAHGLHYNFPGLILSRGPIEPLSTPIHALTGNTLQFLWNGQSVPGAGNDKVSVVLFNANRMTMKFFRNIAQREEGNVSIAIPTSWNSEEIYSYLLVERNGDWSNSFCAGTIPWPEESAPETPANPSPTNPQNQQIIPNSNLDVHPDQSAVKLLLPSPLIRDHG